MMRSDSFINGVKVERGATIFVPTNLDTGPRFRFEAVCQNDEGTEWRATVKIGGSTIIPTDTFPDYARAAHAAEAILIGRFVAAIGDPVSPA